MWTFAAKGGSRAFRYSTKASRVKPGPTRTSASPTSVAHSWTRMSSKKAVRASPEGNILPCPGARTVDSSRTPYCRSWAIRAASSSRDRNAARGFSTRTLISPVFGSRWRTRIRVWRWGPFLLAVSCEGQRSRWANLAGISLSLLSRGRIEPEVRISCIYTKEDLHGPENHHGPGAQGEAKVARVRLHRHMGRGQQGSPDHGTRLSIRLRRHDSGQWENLPIPGFRREGRRPISRPICLVRPPNSGGGN